MMVTYIAFIIDVHYQLMKLSKFDGCNTNSSEDTRLTKNRNQAEITKLLKREKVGQGHMMVTYMALIIDVHYQLVKLSKFDGCNTNSSQDTKLTKNLNQAEITKLFKRKSRSRSHKTP